MGIIYYTELYYTHCYLYATLLYNLILPFYIIAYIIITWSHFIKLILSWGPWTWQGSILLLSHWIALHFTYHGLGYNMDGLKVINGEAWLRLVNYIINYFLAHDWLGL